MSQIVRRVLFIMLVSSASIVGFSQALAQETEPALETSALLQQLPGLQSGVLRVYTAGSETVASPESTSMASPVAMGGSQVTAAILSFDDDANALGGMTKLQTEIQGERSATAVIAGSLGDKRAAFLLEDAEGTVTASVIVVQSGTDVVMVLIEGNLAQDDDVLVEIARTIVESDAGANVAQFVPDGTSAGGQWDRLPAADDALLTGVGMSGTEDIELSASQA